MVFISTQSLMASSRSSVMQAQSDLAKVQQELSTGKHADMGLSLGGGSAQILTLNLQASRLQAYSDTNAVASARLQSTASSLTAMQTTATSFLSTLATANPTSAAISAVLSTAQSNLSAMTSLLNTTIGGDYIFAGINTAQQPLTAYTTTPPSAAKQAVDASFQSTFGFSPTAPSASSITADQMKSYLDTTFAPLFNASNFSGTWSSASSTAITSEVAANQSAATSVSGNESAFRNLAQAYTMVSEFVGQNLNAAASQVVITAATAMISSAVTGLTNLNANVGVSQAAISDANTSMSAQISLLTTQSNGLQSIDPAALSISVTTLQTQIQASYEITARLQKLSMVNYMP